MKEKTLSAIELSGHVSALEQQRNMALMESVLKSGQLQMAVIKIQNLVKEIEELKKQDASEVS